MASVAGTVVTVALATGACAPTGSTSDVLDDVAGAVNDFELWSAYDVTVSEAAVVEATRLAPDDSDMASDTDSDDNGDPRDTWCVAVDAVASDPAHWVHGRSIWLTSFDDGEWSLTPTLIIAVKDVRSWDERCAFESGDAVAGQR